ncbi:MAG: DUF4344 domain-containing metallopeptidase [Gammaproteobacteria bacterium]|nr:DUF4344 domain-containing metallopeptidase [Gammaproteobacteria bacterium]
MLSAGSASRQSGGQQSAGQQSGAYAPSTHPTRIQLYFDKSKVYAGDTVTFYGLLTANGRPLPGATVYIKENDLGPDDLIATVQTGHDGRFATRVVAKDWDKWGGASDIYAVFEGSERYLRYQTPDYQLTVIKRSGSLTLDPIPRGVHIGDPVTFSGSLSLHGIDTTNVIVYIKDEDALNPDDLLVTAYVDSSGRYSATWIAEKVDVDRIADIYAVFEGDSRHYRLTTCDPNPTRLFGGLCNDTRPLTTWPARPITPPGPPNTEYVALQYTIPFQGRPTVAISPSHDSYETTRQHIIPAREGIEKLSSELAARHGGNWLANFEVLTPGKWRADMRADIIVNIVTGDDNSRCNEIFGWAPRGKLNFPIQINVCSTTGDGLRASSDVMRTATHEFAHAVGLGHTFNKRNDMMCSVEDSRATCPGTYNKELRPSKLVLDAMAELYGRDGYAVPNNNVHKDYFAYGSSKTTGTERTSSWARQNPASGGETSLTLEIAPSKKFSEYASYVKSLNYFAPEIAYLNDKLVLPHDTNVRVGECGRANDLYYPDLHAIRICYEDIKEYVSTAHNLEYSDEDTHNYVMSNLEFALYRGIGYALIDSFVPNNSGHREESADSFAAYLILTTYEDPDTGHDILYDASTQLYVYSESNRDNAALREHALGRFNLLTCYAYGQDPEAREYLSTEGWLPDNIRDSCESLYDNVVRMWEGIMPGYLKA